MKHHPNRRPLASALLLALLAPGAAFAQSAEALEARIKQLEAQVQALLEARQAAPAPAPAAATPGKPALQTTPIVATPNTSFSYGGFIKLDALSTWTSDGAIADSTPGRMFYFPGGTPVAAIEDGKSYTDFHAQFSRVWFGVDHVTERGDKVKGMVEFDFFGGGNTNVGNEKFSNGYPPTVRHAYVSWNNWLAGQTWTNFMDLGSLPESVDFVGVVDGTVFVRQSQIRYTKGGWSVSLENPQTWYQAGTPAHVGTGDNNVPDLTARWQTRGAWGHFSIAGLVRQLKAGDDTATGAALSVAGSAKLGANDTLQYMLSGGPGIGRYLAFGLGADAGFDANGDLEAQDMYAGFVGWRHNYSSQLRSTIAYSFAELDDAEKYGGPAATAKTQSIRANLIYSPFPKLDIGAEISAGRRELVNGLEGDIKRFHTTVKYTF